MRFVQVQTIVTWAPCRSFGKKSVHTRGWFQCDACGLVAAIEPILSPMQAPECPAGCNGPEL